MNIFKLSVRGLSRNLRRSLVTFLAIAFGFAAVALFAGYTHNIYDGLSRQAIHAELLGHLTISKRGMRTEGKLDPERFLFSRADIQKISELLANEEHIKWVSPRLAISGMLSNGQASTIFIAEGITADAMVKLQENMFTKAEIKSGLGDVFLKKLDAAHPEQVLVSQGLADMLRLQPGDIAPVLTSTLTGQANALDIKVSGTFTTGNSGTNDKFIFMPLALAQSLYDVDGGADRMTLLLDSPEQTDIVREQLQSKLAMAGFDVEILTWKELSDFYNQVRDMFDMIFGFIFLIVLTVVIMSVANSMGMTVVERTREIGTLRAIGLKRSGVVRLFTMESLVLSLIGISVGLMITLAVSYAINSAYISYVPPGNASAVLLHVNFDRERVMAAAFMMLFVGSLAAYLPARRASRQPITQALGHV
ncbi:MAG: FtsX-like permease family protein [Marinagarivorans sp.]|nr:FtsX-like permease family protein [Marinagarivorans sp.]